MTATATVDTADEVDRLLTLKRMLKLNTMSASVRLDLERQLPRRCGACHDCSSPGPVWCSAWQAHVDELLRQLKAAGLRPQSRPIVQRPKNLTDRMKLASRQAEDLWGKSAQLDMVNEELAEAIVAVQHYRRGRKKKHEVIDELADVYIVTRHLRVALGITDDEVHRALQKKVARLEGRIDAGGAGHQGDVEGLPR
jgi:NTP pyrophosphatase (non-canonical NTP hydrolase)